MTDINTNSNRIGGFVKCSINTNAQHSRVKQGAHLDLEVAALSNLFYVKRAYATLSQPYTDAALSRHQQNRRQTG